MFTKRTVNTNKINSSVLEATILESGNIGEINQGIFRINQLSGNNLEPTALNVFLKVENEKVELSFFADEMILHMENPKDTMKILLELIKTFSKVVGYKINIQKTVACGHWRQEHTRIGPD